MKADLWSDALADKERAMGQTSYRADPIPHRAAQLPQVPAVPRDQAWSPQILAELNRYGITVFDNVYEWGGSRYGNAPDAIAAAKRGSKPGRIGHQ